tara:strand:- start:115 stop:867 length:753 start_codon:yes stop_codon:yes gene_type:complete
MAKIIHILSGGMDSTTLLYKLINENNQVKAISFDYGQRHSKELSFAEYHCKKLKVDHEIIDISSIMKIFGKDSALINKDVEVPDGHYEELVMKKTVVPNRNMIMLSLATAYCIGQKYDQVSYGSHFGDHAIYPDCRQIFSDALGIAIQLCDWREIKLIRPFIDINKKEVAIIGKNLQIDYTKTWSCYKGLELQCGVCGTCIERREAFYLAGVEDLDKNYIQQAPTLEKLISYKFKVPKNKELYRSITLFR